MMLVHTQRKMEKRLSVRDNLLGPWNQVLARQLPAQAQQDGNPVFSWDAFPTWDPLLNSGKIYITIFQKLVIDVPHWPSDYQASFTLWVQVHRKSDGTLEGFVRKSYVWVEGGAGSQVV